MTLLPSPPCVKIIHMYHHVRVKVLNCIETQLISYFFHRLWLWCCSLHRNL